MHRIPHWMQMHQSKDHSSYRHSERARHTRCFFRHHEMHPHKSDIPPCGTGPGQQCPRPCCR
nr:MAG TPA: hypothetical protein [Bacteriophage sp.]